MPILQLAERADVLVDQLRRGAQHDRGHRRHVHDVTHGRGRTAVARERLADHREGHVVLAEPAVLLRHGEGEEAVLGEDLEVAARVEQLVVGALRVGAHLLLAELDQLRAQLLLALGEEPVRIPLVAESPERLVTPRLVRHSSPPGSKHSRTNLYRGLVSRWAARVHRRVAGPARNYARSLTLSETRGRSRSNRPVPIGTSGATRGKEGCIWRTPRSRRGNFSRR